jgi:hypothetical protein
MEHCINCNQMMAVNFCSHCGQKKYARIDKKYIWDEAQYTFLHLNKGFLYSVKQIIKNPGKKAKDYLDGKRVNHYKPLLLAFVLSGISAFLSYKILGLREDLSTINAQASRADNFASIAQNVVSHYYSIIMLVLVPFFAITTYVSFKREGHNYFEHIVLNAYVLSYYTIMGIVIILPLLFIIKKFRLSGYILLSNFIILVVPFILFWFFKSVYKNRKASYIATRVALVSALTLLGFFALVTVIGLARYFFYH